MSVLIPIAAAQKFRIPRIADIFVQASEPRSWINDRADFFQRCDMTSRGQFCTGAREVPCGARVSKTIEKCDFWKFGVVEMHFFARNRRNRSKLIELTPEPTQIDPRGHDATRNSDICSYSAGQVPEKSVFFMSAIRELGFSGGDVCHWSLKGGVVSSMVKSAS